MSRLTTTYASIRTFSVSLQYAYFLLKYVTAFSKRHTQKQTHTHRITSLLYGHTYSYYFLRLGKSVFILQKLILFIFNSKCVQYL